MLTATSIGTSRRTAIASTCARSLPLRWQPLSKTSPKTPSNSFWRPELKSSGSTLTRSRNWNAFWSRSTSRAFARRSCLKESKNAKTDSSLKRERRSSNRRQPLSRALKGGSRIPMKKMSHQQFNAASQRLLRSTRVEKNSIVSLPVRTFNTQDNT